MNEKKVKLLEIHTTGDIRFSVNNVVQYTTVKELLKKYMVVDGLAKQLQEPMAKLPRHDVDKFYKLWQSKMTQVAEWRKDEPYSCFVIGYFSALNWVLGLLQK